MARRLSSLFTSLKVRKSPSGSNPASTQTTPNLSQDNDRLPDPLPIPSPPIVSAAPVSAEPEAIGPVDADSLDRVDNVLICECDEVVLSALLEVARQQILVKSNLKACAAWVVTSTDFTPRRTNSCRSAETAGYQLDGMLEATGPPRPDDLQPALAAVLPKLDPQRCDKHCEEQALWCYDWVSGWKVGRYAATARSVPRGQMDVFLDALAQTPFQTLWLKIRTPDARLMKAIIRMISSPACISTLVSLDFDVKPFPAEAAPPLISYLQSPRAAQLAALTLNMADLPTAAMVSILDWSASHYSNLPLVLPPMEPPEMLPGDTTVDAPMRAIAVYEPSTREHQAQRQIALNARSERVRTQIHRAKRYAASIRGLIQSGRQRDPGLPCYIVEVPAEVRQIIAEFCVDGKA